MGEPAVEEGVARTAGRDGSEARRAAQRLALVLSAVLALPLVSPSTCVLLFVGLLPTIVAFVADRSPHRTEVAAVGGLNAAGVAPFLFQLWFDSPGMPGAMSILTNAFDMVTMYGAAAVGWALHAGSPELITLFDGWVMRRRIEQLRSRQQELLEEWGADVVRARMKKKDREAVPPKGGVDPAQPETDPS